MKLGFVSAILPDFSFEEVMVFAGEEGFDCVEVMCWPPGKANRRYAGVTHIDVTAFSASDSERIRNVCRQTGVVISGLGYYPNPLTPDEEEAEVYVQHLQRVLEVASDLELNVVNTFVGRDWTQSLDDNWSRFEKTWIPLVERAESLGVKIAIENCPMFFTDDEWPGGKNLAHSPSVWKRMFTSIPSEHFGLNYDPSHMIWQHMNYIKPIRTFAHRFFHIHAKDVRLDQHLLDDVGIMATPNAYHTPKLPGLGDVDWGTFFSALTDTGYDGAVCVEVEDRAYEGSPSLRKRAIRQSHTYLRQFVPRE